MRILIAEDDVTSRNILSAMLRKWGFEPVVTPDGNAAWAALQRADAPKLVLLDRNMPAMDGLEVCRRLRKAESTDPSYVLLLTDQAAKGDIVQGLEAGANDYVSKPYDNDELQARIRVGQRLLDLQARLLETRNALEHLATHDALTGLLNRRAILARLAQEISRAKRDDGALSVAMCDLDHFKLVNDTHGHQVGDEVLVAFSNRFRGKLRDYDCVGRYGGEEFLVIAPVPAAQKGGSVFERLRASVAHGPIETKAGAVRITVSIGVASGTGQSTVDALLAAADDALYRAKAEGRNRVAYAAEEVPTDWGPTQVGPLSEGGQEDQDQCTGDRSSVISRQSVADTDHCPLITNHSSCRRWLRITVEDNGPGIREEIRDGVFDPFFTTKNRTRHSGLGLWISRSVVQDHGGDLISFTVSDRLRGQ